MSGVVIRQMTCFYNKLFIKYEEITYDQPEYIISVLLGPSELCMFH
jgi:hypothetical protein